PASTSTPTNTPINTPINSPTSPALTFTPTTPANTSTVVAATSTSTSVAATNTSTPGAPTATPTVCIMKFKDVHPEDWFYGYVEWMYCHGVVSGYNTIPPCDASGPNAGIPCFKPGNNTTRGQEAKIVVRAFGFPINTTGGPHFSDVPPTNVFYPYVETAKNMGLVTGYGDGTYRPNNPVTRGQIAKIVVNAAVIYDPAHWQLLDPTPNYTFTDVP